MKQVKYDYYWSVSPNVTQEDRIADSNFFLPDLKEVNVIVRSSIGKEGKYEYEVILGGKTERVGQLENDTPLGIAIEEMKDLIKKVMKKQGYQIHSIFCNTMVPQFEDDQDCQKGIHMGYFEVKLTEFKDEKLN
jgi:hypothetical protein